MKFIKSFIYDASKRFSKFTQNFVNNLFALFIQQFLFNLMLFYTVLKEFGGIIINFFGILSEKAEIITDFHLQLVNFLSLIYVSKEMNTVAKSYWKNILPNMFNIPIC